MASKSTPPPSILSGRTHNGAAFVPPIVAGLLWLAGVVTDHVHVGHVRLGKLGPLDMTAPAYFLASVLVTLGVWGALQIVNDRQDPADGNDVEMPRTARVFYTAAALTSGLWLTWVAATSPWGMPQIMTLAFAAVCAAPLYAALRNRRTQKRVDKRAAITEQTKTALRNGDKETWERVFREIGWTGLEYVRTEATMAGERIVCNLPVSGKLLVGRMRNADRLAALTIVAGLPRQGCVDVRQPSHSVREVWLEIDRKDILATDLPLPDDTSELSINNPFPVGGFAFGAPIEVLFRQISALIGAPRGSGKSVLIHVILAAMFRMKDCVIWMIDMKEGSVFRPWLQPWIDDSEGFPRPLIEWVADTPEEAELMLEGWLGGMEWRAANRRGVSKIRPSEELPALVLIADEISRLTGTDGKAAGINPSRYNNLLNRGLKVSRSEAMEVILASQRVVQQYVSLDVSSHCGMRFALGGPNMLNDSDANRVLPDDHFAAAQLFRMRHPGSLMFRPDQTKPYQAGKVFSINDEDPEVIAQLAWARAQYARPLDAGTARAVHERCLLVTDGQHGYFEPAELGLPEAEFTGRWSRAKHLFNPGHKPVRPEVKPEAVTAARPDNAAAPGRAGTATAERGASPKPVVIPPPPGYTPGGGGKPEQPARKDPKQIDAEVDRIMRGVDWDRMFGGMTLDAEQPAAGGTPPGDDGQGDDRDEGQQRLDRDMIVDALREIGPRGAGPGRIRGVLEQRPEYNGPDRRKKAPGRQHITNVCQNHPDIVQPGGPQTPYIHRMFLPEDTAGDTGD